MGIGGAIDARIVAAAKQSGCIELACGSDRMNEVTSIGRFGDPSTDDHY